MTHRPRAKCNNCGTPAPCRVYTEGRYDHGTLRGYQHGCGCTDCRTAGSKARGFRTTRATTAMPDDGIIDEIAVERLLDRTLPWDRATLPERLEAGRRIYHREGGPVFCADVLRLNNRQMRVIRAELAEAS